MFAAIVALVMVIQNPVAGPPLSPRPQVPVVPRTGDATVLGHIGAVDANEVEAAKLAATKATASSVRNLAKVLVKDHEASLTQGLFLAKQLDIERLLPADSAMARAHKTEMATLNTLTGPAFDKAFVQFALADHKAVIAKINGTLLAEAERPEVKGFLQALLPVLTGHQRAEEKWLAAHR